MTEHVQWNPEEVFAQAPFLVAILVGTDCKVLFCSETMNHFVSDRTLKGKALGKAIPELEAQGYLKIFKQVYRTGKAAWHDERLLRIDRQGTGEPEDIYLDLRCEPYRENGKRVGVVVYGAEVTQRVQARMRAAQSEERYQAFIHNSSEGIWCCELEVPMPINLPIERQVDHMYKYAYMAEANCVMAKMRGLKSIEPLLDRRLSQMLPRKDPRNVGLLKEFITTDYRLSGIEVPAADKDGNAIWLRNSLVGTIQDGALVRVWGTHQDVTAERKAAEALRASEERLAIALDASNMGIWEWDMITDELTWSAELKLLFGMPIDAEVTYDEFVSYLNQEDRIKLRREMRQAAKNGKNFQVEHRINWRDGTVHWLQSHGRAIFANGKPVKMIGTARNIDGRKQAEMRLQESEARFRTMADTAPVLIWVSDLDNRCTYFNKPWLEFTGRKLSEQLGDGWAQIMYPDDVPRCRRVYAAALKGHEAFQLECRMRRADGEYRWMLSNGRPRYSPRGDLLGYIGSCLDIHDFKQAVEQRKELEARTRALTEQREHLMALNQAKEEFISLASHQLRTPATAVKQYTGMLLEGYAGPLTDGQRELLTLAFDSNERQIGIVNDLLRVAHLDAGRVRLERVPTDLAALVKHVVNEQLPTFRARQQRLISEVPRTKVTIPVDAVKLRMVIENILDNASKYTGPGKAVTVTLTKDRHDVHISVTDEGVGISKRDYGKLFQKFSRISNERSAEVGGSGLGLYWAKKIMDLHGGMISVTSQRHKGTTFTITIPRA